MRLYPQWQACLDLARDRGYMRPRKEAIWVWIGHEKWGKKQVKLGEANRLEKRGWGRCAPPQE
jgi:hypothetical protein